MCFKQVRPTLVRGSKREQHDRLLEGQSSSHVTLPQRPPPDLEFFRRCGIIAYVHSSYSSTAKN